MGPEPWTRWNVSGLLVDWQRGWVFGGHAGIAIYRCPTHSVCNAHIIWISSLIGQFSPKLCHVYILKNAILFFILSRWLERWCSNHALWREYYEQATLDWCQLRFQCRCIWSSWRWNRTEMMETAWRWIRSDRSLLLPLSRSSNCQLSGFDWRTN